VVKELLNDGRQMQTSQAYGGSPLYCASRSREGHLEVMKADANIANNDVASLTEKLHFIGRLAMVQQWTFGGGEGIVE